MKKMRTIMLAVVTAVVLTSCGTRVAPNHYGVLMENYGKNGKGDYSKQQGRVSDWGPGTELWQVPAFEQRADFEDRVLHLKASNNTEFTAKPLYSFKAVESRVVDLVFANARLGSSSDFMKALEDNVLEPAIYDLIKEESRKYHTDTLMATGGNLKFEMKVQELVKKSFEEHGLELLSFSANLDFDEKVKEKISNRNEVSTNITVIDQQIFEQLKQNKLDSLKTVNNLIKSKGITQELLQQQFIEAWKETKQPLYFAPPALQMLIKGNK